jgi:hypothetical protein
MKKLFIIGLFLFFSCSNEYADNNKVKENYLNSEIEINNELSDFSFDKISYLT